MTDLVGSKISDLERAAGIEPACLTWKDSALPLSYARVSAVIKDLDALPSKSFLPGRMFLFFLLLGSLMTLEVNDLAGFTLSFLLIAEIIPGSMRERILTEFT